MAAVVLYLLSAGQVRGFAFALGLATVLDLLVVFTFRHPLMPCWPAPGHSCRPPSVVSTGAGVDRAQRPGLRARGKRWA